MPTMDEIVVWVKLRDHFVNQNNIHAIYRVGGNTKIERILGDSFIVDISYDKVIKMFPKPNSRKS